jgi:hypothetical protein
MTASQRRRRAIYWRGSLTATTLFTLLMLLGALADAITQ